LEKVSRALVSVSNKEGVAEFCRTLQNLGVDILSTGGTAAHLVKEGIAIIPVNDVTGFPEMMDGRVKTLHPRIHGGILGMRDNTDHSSQAEEHGIDWIDMVVVNLYPFESVSREQNADNEELIENIDIGGPTLIRSAAKNHRYVTVVVDPRDYSRVAESLAHEGAVSPELRRELAVKAFRRTAAYDACIDRVLSERILDEQRISFFYGKGKNLRYGENSHQSARFYLDESVYDTSVARAGQIHGKEMSYNNYVDADAALEIVKEFDEPAVAVVKHTNPCGLATGKTPRQALENAWDGDPVSAYGSVISCNRAVDLDFANFLKSRNEKHISYVIEDGTLKPRTVPVKFVEVIVAPRFEKDALDLLSKTKNIRLLQTGPFSKIQEDLFTCRKITGGMLVMEKDAVVWEDFTPATKKKFSAVKKKLARFACVAVKHTKSNAVVLAREYRPGLFKVAGMGAGQPNRVDSLRKLAYTKMRENMRIEFDAQSSKQEFQEYLLAAVKEMVLASDAFFPFDDTVREAGSLGIRYIVQPGGSKRDKDSAAACDELGIAMAMTGTRHFKH